MPDIDFANLLGELTSDEEGTYISEGCQCPLSGTRAYELTVDAGSILLSCVACGETFDPDALDMINTGEIGLPVTITWAMESGGFGEPDELWGDLEPPQPLGEQLEEARALAGALLSALNNLVESGTEITDEDENLDFDRLPDWLTQEQRGITTWQREPESENEDPDCECFGPGHECPEDCSCGHHDQSGGPYPNHAAMPEPDISDLPNLVSALLGDHGPFASEVAAEVLAGRRWAAEHPEEAAAAARANAEILAKLDKADRASSDDAAEREATDSPDYAPGFNDDEH